MKIRIFEFDGSVDEWNATGLEGKVSFEQVKADRGSKEEEPPNMGDQLANDQSFLRLVLERLPLSPSQDTLFRQFLAADPERWISRSEIGEALQRTQDQIDGVLGALGKRVNATPRDDMDTVVGIGVLFEFRSGPEWNYRLRPTFRSVLEVHYGNH